MATSSAGSYLRAPPTGKGQGYWWQTLKDEQLLKVRFCDLGLSLERSVLKLYVDRLYAELQARGVEFRPHCWLADEWFSADGVPGIAIPFYLAHPRLRRLEKVMMGHVEGGNDNWLMRLLRHEAGHAIDTAYRLRRRRAFREVFGPVSTPYPDAYVPRPGSRRYVQHLGGWYAQSHPTEDFAETFAVWLKPGSRWREEYADWPALRKLLYVDEAIKSYATMPALVRNRCYIDPCSNDRRTLGDHYRVVQSRYRERALPRQDALLKRIFASEPGPNPQRAAALLRRLTPSLSAQIAERAGCTKYCVHQLVRSSIGRADQLGLYVSGNPRKVTRTLTDEFFRLTETMQKRPGRRIVL